MPVRSHPDLTDRHAPALTSKSFRDKLVDRGRIDVPDRSALSAKFTEKLRDRNGLPPVASEHARQSRSPAAPPRSARTSLATAASLNGCGRRTGARASSISGTRSPGNPSAPVRTDSATRIGSPCNRGARCSRNLSDGPSAQCASSTTKTSGPRSARLATSQYRPCSVANAMSAVFCARATSVNTGPASCAAPDNRRSRSAASSLRTALSSNWRTMPNPKPRSSSPPRALCTAIPSTEARERR